MLLTKRQFHEICFHKQLVAAIEHIGTYYITGMIYLISFQKLHAHVEQKILLNEFLCYKAFDNSNV